MNKFLRTVIIASLTHTFKAYSSRMSCEINGDKKSVVPDQIKAVDKRGLDRLCIDWTRKKFLN